MAAPLPPGAPSNEHYKLIQLAVATVLRNDARIKSLEKNIQVAPYDLCEALNRLTYVRTVDLESTVDECLAVRTGHPAVPSLCDPAVPGGGVDDCHGPHRHPPRSDNCEQKPPSCVRVRFSKRPFVPQYKQQPTPNNTHFPRRTTAGRKKIIDLQAPEPTKVTPYRLPDPLSDDFRMCRSVQRVWNFCGPRLGVSSISEACTELHRVCQGGIKRCASIDDCYLGRLSGGWEDFLTYTLGVEVPRREFPCVPHAPFCELQ